MEAGYLSKKMNSSVLQIIMIDSIPSTEDNEGETQISATLKFEYEMEIEFDQRYKFNLSSEDARKFAKTLEKWADVCDEITEGN